MSIFSPKRTLRQSGLFEGMTDWHCHLLPGVDDGVQHLQETLEILDHYGQLGVAEVWLTPHVMEDIPNKPADLQQQYQQLLQEYKGPIKLHLAAENMLDTLFDQRIVDKNFLPIGPKGRHLLVETSYYAAPADFDQLIENIKAAGYYPVLAHPERYMYMTPKDYKSLRERDVVFQLNIFSLLGAYGDEAKRRAAMLLKKGYYTLAGTDMHRHSQLQRALDARVLTKGQVRRLRALPMRLS